MLSTPSLCTGRARSAGRQDAVDDAGTTNGDNAGGGQHPPGPVLHLAPED